jgi:hypothetical protein
MIAWLSILVVLSCPDTKMWNASKYPWNKHDYQMLDRTKIRCGQLYPNSPCVKLFRKYDFQSYSAICSHENN